MIKKTRSVTAYKIGMLWIQKEIQLNVTGVNFIIQMIEAENTN